MLSSNSGFAETYLANIYSGNWVVFIHNFYHYNLYCDLCVAQFSFVILFFVARGIFVVASFPCSGLR